MHIAEAVTIVKLAIKEKGESSIDMYCERKILKVIRKKSLVAAINCFLLLVSFSRYFFVNLLNMKL